PSLSLHRGNHRNVNHFASKPVVLDIMALPYHEPRPLSSRDTGEVLVSHPSTPQRQSHKDERPQPGPNHRGTKQKEQLPVIPLRSSPIIPEIYYKCEARDCTKNDNKD